MKFKLTLLFFIPLTALVVMPVAAALHVYADDEETPPIEAQKVVDAKCFVRDLATLSPTDNISLTVYLKKDPNVEKEIEAIEKGPAEIVYREVGNIKGRGNIDGRKALRLVNVKGSRIDSLLEQAYSDMQNKAIEKIEQLPDTEVTAHYLYNNSLRVDTKVVNIAAIAVIPDVVRICEDTRYLFEPLLDAWLMGHPPKDSPRIYVDDWVDLYMAEPQPPLALTIVIILAISLCAVYLTWLVIVGRNKAK